MASEKTRNNGQWTEARYVGFITSVLRAGSRRWPPKWAVLAAAYVGKKTSKKTKREAKHYKCAECKEDFPQSGVQVDHREPIGKTDSWDVYIEKLFCEAENLQVLCKACHKNKSRQESARRHPDDTKERTTKA